MQKVETVKIKNVYDKEQLYLIIGEGDNKVVINIGQKTYNAINELNADRITKIATQPQNEQKNKKEVNK